MSDQRAHAIYRRLLLTRGHGYPFWIPEPDSSLPPEYCSCGISVGDVGLLTDDGGFDFLFNVHLPADHPVHGGYVFAPIPLVPCNIRETPIIHSEKGSVTSARTTAQSLAFEASSSC